MNIKINRILYLFGIQKIFGISIIIACFIKFNIVLFTYNNYTATKLFFPIYLLILIGITIRKFNRKLFANLHLWFLLLVCIGFLFPFGYLGNPYDWKIYRQWSLSLISYISIYYGVFYLTKTQKKILFFAAFAFCFISLVYVILQAYLNISYTSGHMRTPFSGDRPYGILDDPDHSSGLLLIALFYCIGLAFYHRKFLLLLPMIFGILFGLQKFNSYGALFGLIAGGAILILGIALVFVRQKNAKRIFIVFLSIWLSIFAFMVLFYWFYSFDYLRIQALFSEKASSISQRLKLIDWGMAIFFDNPIFGVGTANDFNPEVHKLYSSQTMGVVNNLHVHTSIVSAFATTGVWGGTPLVLLITSAIYRFSYLFFNQINRRKKYFIVAMFSLFIAIQVLSCSLQMLYSISYWFTLLLPFLLDFTLPNSESTPQGKKVEGT